MSASISDVVKLEAAEAFIEFHTRQTNIAPVTPVADLSIGSSSHNGYVAIMADMDYGDPRFMALINIYFVFMSGWNACQAQATKDRIDALVNG